MLYKKYNGMKSNLAQKYINQYAKKLADEGRKLVIKAYETANFNKDKTQNLHDSYGCAVFYNKKLVPNTKYTFTSRAIEARYNMYTNELEHGRQEINEFFNNYKPHTDGFELVVAVAMFYGKILENGKKLRKKYVVISGIDKDFDLLKEKVGGRVIDLNP